jgi:hypothetical protein
VNIINDSNTFNIAVRSSDKYWLLVQDTSPGSRVKPLSRSTYQASQVPKQPLLIITCDSNENLSLTPDSWPFEVAHAARPRPEIYIS